MKTWQIGEELCDMHYGLPTKSGYPERVPLETRNHIRFYIKDYAWIETLLQSVGVKDAWYCNKMAVVLSERKGDYDGWMVAAYCYDGMTAGIFEFMEKRDVAAGTV